MRSEQRGRRSEQREVCPPLSSLLSPRSSLLSPRSSIENQVLAHAIAHIVPGHVAEVRARRLEQVDKVEREALGGKVYDVLGRLFDQTALRDLLMDAVRYGDDPAVKARLDQTVEGALDRDKLRAVLETRALVHDSMDTSRIQAIREDMERAQARRLQPHFIQAFFLDAFKRLGGRVHRREPGRWEITHVPAAVRERDRHIGQGAPVLKRYERICFEKDKVDQQPRAELIAPGSPLLSSTIDLVMERHGELLKRGAVLVDETDPGDQPRLLFYVEHAVQDGRRGRSGELLVISKRMHFVEVRREDGGERVEGSSLLAPHSSLLGRREDGGERVEGSSLLAPHSSLLGRREEDGLPGLDRVAEGHGGGAGGVPVGSAAPSGGNLRDAVADHEGGGVDSSQHRGGVVPRDAEGQGALPGHRPGFAGRNRDAAGPVRGSGVVPNGGDGALARTPGRGEPHPDHVASETPPGLTEQRLVFSDAGAAPYLDYRPATPVERALIFDEERGMRREEREVCPPLSSLLSPRSSLENQVLGYAIAQVAPGHVAEVRAQRLDHVDKVEREVKARLTREVTYWDRRAQDLKEKERAGKRTRLPAQVAQERADRLADRLQTRLRELELERHIIPAPPRVTGGALVIPQGLLDRLQGPTGDGGADRAEQASQAERERVERLAMAAVMEVERALGRQPRDVSAQRGLGYDIESRNSDGALLFIEVKGRQAGASSVTLTKNEILAALNTAEQFRLAIVEVDGDQVSPPVYVQGFDFGQPGFAQTSATYSLGTLLEHGGPPA